MAIHEVIISGGVFIQTVKKKWNIIEEVLVEFNLKIAISGLLYLK